MFDFYRFQQEYRDHWLKGMQATTTFRMQLQQEVTDADGMTLFRGLAIPTEMFNEHVKEVCEKIIQNPDDFEKAEPGLKILELDFTAWAIEVA